MERLLSVYLPATVLSWRGVGHGAVHVIDTLHAAFSLADDYVSEHVGVLIAEPRRTLNAMRNYGALFLGSGICVSYGDKVIGTKHTLPTRGAARYTGGLWVGKWFSRRSPISRSSTLPQALAWASCAGAQVESSSSRGMLARGTSGPQDLIVDRFRGTPPYRRSKLPANSHRVCLAGGDENRLRRHTPDCGKGGVCS